LQSLAEETFRFKKSKRPFAYISRHHIPAADRAAAAGFVLSMMFLASAALYALTLSQAFRPVFSEAFILLDGAARDAGFRLETLALSGLQNTPQKALLDALDLPYRGSSLFYSASVARSRLDGIGWIESAKVRRILPSELEVALNERIPFARWQDEAGNIQVIDRDGNILGEDGEGRFKSLTLFAGEGARPLAKEFEEALLERDAVKRRIQRIELIVDHFWAVKLENGLILKLPRKLTQVVLSRLDSLLASPSVAGLELASIDLRLSNRTILQLLEPTVANRDKAIAALNSAPLRALALPRKGRAL
jgi:cell division protein FtsQ